MDLLLSFEGRIGRKLWWVGLIVMLLALLVLYLGVVIVVGMGPAGRFAMLALTLLFLWPAAALTVKRLADQGKRPMPRLALWFGPALMWSVLQSSGIGYRRASGGPGMPDIVEPGIAPTLLMVLTVVVFVWMVVELGILSGRNSGSGES